MFQKGYGPAIAVTIVLLFTNPAYTQSTFTYKPGNGIKWTSEDESAQFRILGYIQATANTHEHFDDNNPGNQFFVRRARLDVDFEYLDTYQIFFEWMPVAAESKWYWPGWIFHTGKNIL